ncbi:hypothetical protein EYF80_005707 [Liparis tanakae]|uniref:Uncharacterized protein n=1 Tax=Liparis tanakae TaxID=230148 RepID=A0A4Z2J2C0_9TELE|nr:hypothetical protein EYF80_005707 [Liparis tanakae]
MTNQEATASLNSPALAPLMTGQWFVKISDIKDAEGQKGPREPLMHHLLQMFWNIEAVFSSPARLLREASVGVKANDRKWERGNQNQNWVKTSKPTNDGIGEMDDKSINCLGK